MLKQYNSYFNERFGLPYQRLRIINDDDTRSSFLREILQLAERVVNRDLLNASMSQWFKQNGIAGNTEKRKALVLGNIKRKIEYVDIRIPVHTVLVSNEIKLLGVALDNKLKFDSHIALVRRKVCGQVNELNRIRNILPWETKATLYLD